MNHQGGKSCAHPFIHPVQLFGTVSEAVNKRFNFYMARKGHLGSIKLDKEAQTLQLKVCT